MSTQTSTSALAGFYCITSLKHSLIFLSFHGHHGLAWQAARGSWLENPSKQLTDHPLP